MKSSTTYNPSTAFALLLLGRPKSGKTTLSLQFPSPYIADLDNNLSGAVRYFRESSLSIPFSYDTIPLDDSGNEVPLSARYQRFNSCITAAAKSPEIKTLIVDSCTALNDIIKAEICRLQNVKKLHIQHWDDVAFSWKHIISQLRASGKNVIFTAHTKLEKNEIDGSLVQHVLVQGQARDFLAGLFSDCWLCYLDASPHPQPPAFKIRTMQDRRFLDLGSSLGLAPIIPNDYKTQIEPHLFPAS